MLQVTLPSCLIMWERSLSLVAKAEVQACTTTDGDGGGSEFGGVETQERVATRFDTYRYLTFKWSFGGMHMLHMAAQMVRSVQKETRSRLNFGPRFFSF